VFKNFYSLLKKNLESTKGHKQTGQHKRACHARQRRQRKVLDQNAQTVIFAEKII
jgi:hypothetical protein